MRRIAAGNARGCGGLSKRASRVGPTMGRGAADASAGAPAVSAAAECLAAGSSATVTSLDGLGDPGRQQPGARTAIAARWTRGRQQACAVRAGARPQSAMHALPAGNAGESDSAASVRSAMGVIRVLTRRRFPGVIAIQYATPGGGEQDLAIGGAPAARGGASACAVSPRRATPG